MIGKAKACIGGAALADYIMKPEKGYELMRNKVYGDTPSEVLRDMEIIRNLNQRAKNKTFSLVLSPEKLEGHFLSDAKLRTLTREFMEELGIDPKEQEFIAFVHTEKAHKHIHILANRVTIEGKLISDHHIGKRAQWAADRIARKHGLISAKQRQIRNIKEKANNERELKGIKRKIKKKHDWVMKQNPNSVKSYINLMSKLEVKVIPVYNKYSNKLQGLRVKDLETGKEFKSSEVHRNMSLNQILKTGIPFENDEITEAREAIEYDSSNNWYEILRQFSINLNQTNYYEEEDVVNKKKKRKKYKGRTL